MPSLSAASAFAVLLPPLSAAFAFAVISTCVSTAKALGHVPPGVAYPPISLAGIYAPEYYLFAPGFCAIALLLFVNENNFSRAFAAAPPAAPAAAEQLAALALARSVARAGFAGLAVTGVVPLQGWGEGASAAHGLGSLAFFASSLFHGYSTLNALAAEGLRGHPLHKARAPLLWHAKAAALLSCFCAFLPAQLLHPGGEDVFKMGGAEAVELDRGGFAQWWLVASLVLYFTLFAGDIYVLKRGDKKE